MATHDTVSPKIISVGWGKMIIEQLGVGKDFKLWPGGGRSWDWNENGTGHARGIQVEDVKEIVSHGAKVIILTKGVFSRLKVPAKTKTYIEENNIEVIVTSTNNGVKIYNDYVKKHVPVGGLFHSTC